MLKAVLKIERSVEDSYLSPTVFVLEAVNHQTGELVAGHEVHLEIAGDGSLRGGPVTKSSEEVTNGLGMFIVSWWEYPNYSPRRKLEGEIHVSSDDTDVLIRQTAFFMGN